MDEASRAVGRLSAGYEFAEGWRRHLHLGFSTKEIDPLRDALADCSVVDEIYEQELHWVTPRGEVTL